MSKNNIKPGEKEWLKKRLHFNWQIIQRNPEYINFCNEHEKAFDETDCPALDEVRLDIIARKKAKEIKKRFGLYTIYHHEADIPENYILKWPVFENDRAAECELCEKEPNLFTPIWDDHYIKMKIDINRTDGEIKNQISGMRSSDI